MLTAEVKHPGEMVPSAMRTNLNHVTRQFVVLARQLVEFGELGDATPMRWQSGSEHVTHMDELVFLTDRTRLVDGFADVLSSPNKLGMGIAHVHSRQPTPVVLVDQVTTGEAIIDSGRAPEGAPNRIWPKRHEAKGYRRQGGPGAGPDCSQSTGSI